MTTKSGVESKTPGPGSIFSNINPTYKKILIGVAVVFIAVLALRVRANHVSATAEKKATAGLASYKKGDFKAAVSDLEQSAKLNPANDKAQRALGQSYEATGKLDEAAKAYQDSLKANPDQPEVLYNLAIIYKSQGKNQEAIEELEKAVEQNKNFVAAKIILGDLYVQEGQKDKAKEQYQAVIDMKPFGVDLKSVKGKLGQL